MKKKQAHILLLLVSAPILASLSGCGDGASAAAKGEAALAAGNYQAAAKALDTAARKTEPTSHLYYNLGAAKARAGDVSGAIRAFENAGAADISNLDALVYRALMLQQSGDLVGAHELLDRAIDEAPDSKAKARILNSLAVVEYGLGREDLACLRLAKAIRTDPGYAPSYYNVAHILEETYQFHAEALANIAKFIEMADAGDPRLEKAEKFMSAVKAAHGAPAKAPHNSTPAASKLVNQGKDAYARSRWANAESLFAKALDADPESYEAAAYLAATHYASRHYDAAAEAYAKAAALRPDMLDPVFYQALIAYTADNPARALQLLSAVAIPRWPDNPKSYELAAYSWAKLKRYYEARLYGSAFIELSKISGANVAQFEKWFAQLPQTPFQPDN